MDGIVIDEGNSRWLSADVWTVPPSAASDPPPAVLAPVSGHPHLPPSEGPWL